MLYSVQRYSLADKYDTKQDGWKEIYHESRQRQLGGHHVLSWVAFASKIWAIRNLDFGVSNVVFVTELQG